MPKRKATKTTKRKKTKKRKTKKQDKKEKGKAAFGWDVFNQDTLYKAHKKKVAKLKPDLEAYEAAKAEAGEDFYRDALISFELRAPAPPTRHAAP